MSVREKTNTMADAARRIGALRKASDMAGQADLAAGMGMTVRNLQQKLGAERGLDPRLLCGASAVLRRKAAEMVAHADKLDELANG